MTTKVTAMDKKTDHINDRQFDTRKGFVTSIVKSGDMMSNDSVTLARAFLSSQDIGEASKRTYGKGLLLFLEWLRGNDIQSPNRETIIRYKEDLKARGLSSYSVSVYIVAIRRFFEWAEGMKYYPNIAKGIKTGKKSNGFRKDSLTVEQIQELLTSIDRTTLEGKRDYAMLNLLIRTGLRTIEAVRANRDDIRQQGGAAVLWIQGKGRDSKDDFVLLTPASLKPLYAYMKADRRRKKTGPLFISLSDRNNGGRLTTRSIRRIVKVRLRGIGIDSDRLTAHSLRHTAITLSLKAGATIQEAQVLGRHANINTTLIYAHNIDRIRNAPERRIDKILSNRLNK